MIKHLFMILSVVFVSITTACSSSSSEYSKDLPIILSENGEITVTDIIKKEGEFYITVEIDPSFCSITQIDAVYKSWEQLFDSDLNRAEDLYVTIPQPHYLLASHPKLLPIIEELGCLNDNGESNQGWIGVNIVITNSNHSVQIIKSINDGTLGCFSSTDDMSNIYKIIE